MYEKILELVIALTINSFIDSNPVVVYGTVDFIVLLIKSIRFLHLQHKKTHQTSLHDSDELGSK